MEIYVRLNYYNTYGVKNCFDPIIDSEVVTLNKNYPYINSHSNDIIEFLGVNFCNDLNNLILQYHINNISKYTFKKSLFNLAIDYNVKILISIDNLKNFLFNKKEDNYDYMDIAKEKEDRFRSKSYNYINQTDYLHEWCLNNLYTKKEKEIIINLERKFRENEEKNCNNCTYNHTTLCYNCKWL